MKSLSILKPWILLCLRRAQVFWFLLMPIKIPFHLTIYCDCDILSSTEWFVFLNISWAGFDLSRQNTRENERKYWNVSLRMGMINIFDLWIT